VNDLTHIINYNLPDDPEVYIHRSGRTGRAGKRGICISVLHMKEKGKLKEVERMLGKTIEYRRVPTGRDICEKQLFNLVDKVENVEVNTEQIDDYLKVIFKKLEWLDRDELIKHFISVEFNRFLASYENAPDLNTGISHENSQSGQGGGLQKSRRAKYRDDKDDPAKRSSWSDRQNRSNQLQGIRFSRFFMNLGKNDQLDKRSVIDLINRQMPGKSVKIGEIEVLRNFSFFEVDDRFGHDVQKAFNKIRYNGKIIGIESAKPKY
jgi:ATP-dependent RNA helicase DeaD